MLRTVSVVGECILRSPCDDFYESILQSLTTGAGREERFKGIYGERHETKLRLSLVVTVCMVHKHPPAD